MEESPHPQAKMATVDIFQCYITTTMIIKMLIIAAIMINTSNSLFYKDL